MITHKGHVRASAAFRAGGSAASGQGSLAGRLSDSHDGLDRNDVEALKPHPKTWPTLLHVYASHLPDDVRESAAMYALRSRLVLIGQRLRPERLGAMET